MSIDVNEKIIVSAVFTGGKLLPRAFMWSNRKYKVTNVISSYSDCVGDTLRYHFVLEVDKAIYEVSLDTRRMVWKLKRIYDDQ